MANGVENNNYGIECILILNDGIKTRIRRNKK